MPDFQQFITALRSAIDATTNAARIGPQDSPVAAQLREHLSGLLSIERRLLAILSAPEITAAGVQASEVERVRADQVAGVMPQIGPLLDAWDGMDNDTKAVLREEAPDLARALVAIGRAMEGGAGVEVPRG